MGPPAPAGEEKIGKKIMKNDVFMIMYDHFL
jgi:hypothetical protein